MTFYDIEPKTFYYYDTYDNTWFFIKKNASLKMWDIFTLMRNFHWSVKNYWKMIIRHQKMFQQKLILIKLNCLDYLHSCKLNYTKLCHESYRNFLCKFIGSINNGWLNEIKTKLTVELLYLLLIISEMILWYCTDVSLAVGSKLQYTLLQPAR